MNYSIIVDKSFEREVKRLSKHYELYIINSWAALESLPGQPFFILYEDA